MKNLSLPVLASLLVTTPAFAESKCDYTHNIDSQFTKTIDRTENIDRNVFPYVEDTRKCIMTMDIVIDGISYPGRGEFVFGPDMAENTACKNAMQRAKEDTIRLVSPEVLQSKTDMDCESRSVVSTASTTDSKPVSEGSNPSTPAMPEHTPAPRPESKVVEKSVPIVTERIISEPVITERIIIQPPQRIIHYSPLYGNPIDHRYDNGPLVSFIRSILK